MREIYQKKSSSPFSVFLLVWSHDSHANSRSWVNAGIEAAKAETFPNCSVVIDSKKVTISSCGSSLIANLSSSVNTESKHVTMSWSNASVALVLSRRVWLDKNSSYVGNYILTVTSSLIGINISGISPVTSTLSSSIRTSLLVSHSSQGMSISAVSPTDLARILVNM